MLKVPFHPDQQAYRATPPPESVLEAQLSGGRPFQRRGILNGNWSVAVQFSCDRKEYDLLCGFYSLWESNPRPFKINLILNESKLQEYVATFNAGSFSLASQRGLSYTVTATLSVRPNKIYISDNLNVARAVAVGIYGSEEEAKRQSMLPLYEIVNIIMPVWEENHAN